MKDKIMCRSITLGKRTTQIYTNYSKRWDFIQQLKTISGGSIDLLGDPTVESENGEPDEKDKQDGSEQGDCKGGCQMSAKFVVSAAHLNPPHVFVAF